MQFRYKTYLQSERWISEIHIDVASAEPITPNEQKRLLQYGQMSVDAGGTITPVTGAAVTLETRLVQVPLDLPIRETFSLGDYANAESLADKWVEVVRGNINTALTALLAHTPTPTEGTFELPEA